MTMETTVGVRMCPDYDRPAVGQSIDKLFEDLGGLDRLIKRGDRVLLKPNLLMSAGPEKAIVTHPAIVEAVAERVIDLGAIAFLGDSPPLGNMKRVLNKSGYRPFMDRLGVQEAPFLTKMTCEFDSESTFRRIDLAAEIFQFDAVINIAKLKTHCQMLLTLAVKNLFGTVIGMDKPAWHLRAGRDVDTFAAVLVQIYHKIRPALSIVDGVLAMEGDGPNNGRPRKVGIVAASQDAVALDAILAGLVGFDPQRLRTCSVAGEMGIGQADPDEISVVGDRLNGFPLKSFRMPRTMSMRWDLSRGNLVRRFMENHVITRPRIDSSVCKSCKVCLKHCPPQAISEDRGSLVIDRTKCISCFCCHELCESDAIRIDQPFLGRMLGRWSR